VIKEVPVEKIVEVEKPNDKVLLLQETLQTLKKELSLKNTKIEELENKNKQLESNITNQKAVYLKGSNLNETM
jgi:peptidoglycan hydrolase CwlO-like protein